MQHSFLFCLFFDCFFIVRQCVFDALENLEHSSAGSAIQRLKDAQLVCEEIYLAAADDEFDDWADADEE